MEELEQSLETYELQLNQVQLALAADPDNEDLVQLNQDIQQLLALTTQSLLEEKKKQLLAQLEQQDEAQPKVEAETSIPCSSNSDTLKATWSS